MHGCEHACEDTTLQFPSFFRAEHWIIHSFCQVIQMFESLLVPPSQLLLEWTTLAEQVYSTPHVSTMIHVPGVCVCCCWVTQTGTEVSQKIALKLKLRRDKWKTLNNQTGKRGAVGRCNEYRSCTKSWEICKNEIWQAETWLCFSGTDQWMRFSLWWSLL